MFLAQQIFGNLLKPRIDGEIEVVPRLRPLDDRGFLLVAERIDFYALLTGHSPHVPVKGLFHSILPHDTALVEIDKLRFLQLIRRNFSHIAQEMGRRHAAWIVALRLDLNHDSGHVEAMRFDQCGIAKGHAVFDLARKQLAAFSSFFSERGRIEAEQISQLLNQDFAIFHIFQRDIQAEARDVIRQKDAVPVIDEATCRFEQHQSGAIVLRQIPIVGSLKNLKMPEAKTEQHHDQQKSDTENEEPSVKVTEF